MRSRLPTIERALLPVLLLVVYLASMGRWPMWDAEMWTLQACLRPFGAMLFMVAEDKHPPLFFVVEWLLFRVHPSPDILRLPAVVAAVAMVAVMQGVATRHIGSWAGRFTALTLATSPFLLAYALNARSSTVMGLLGALALGATLDLVRGDHPRKAAMQLGAWLTVGMYVHYSMGLAWAGAAAGLTLGLWLGDKADRRERAIAGAVALGASALAFAPWAALASRLQGIGANPSPRSFAGLRYLLWPVGPDYVAPGAVLLVLLAAAGLYAVWRHEGRTGPAGPVFGWAAVAVAIPWLWSTEPGTIGKFYLYAPLQGVFALLIGASFATVGDRLPRAGAWVLGLLLVIGALPGLRDVLTPVSNLVSVAPLAPGVYDTRREAMTLSQLPLGHPIALVPTARAAAEWVYYAPSLGALRPGTAAPAGAWRALTRTSDAKLLAEYHASAREGCVITEGLSSILVIPSAADCRIVRQRLDAVGRQERYGPFLLESAVYAQSSGDVDGAIALASAAAAASPVSARPEWMLAGMLVRQQRPAEALDAAVMGQNKAARYLRRDEWQALARLEVQAARLTGDARRLEEAETRQRCLETRIYTPVARSCQGGWLALL